MQSGKPLRTAKQTRSIWKGLSEDAFRQTVIALSRVTNGVPVDSKRWWSTSMSSQSLPTSIECRLLSSQTEQRLADDFAFISAAQEGVESVAAVCIEEIREPMGLVIRVAANEGIREEIRNALKEICDSLMSCAQAGRYSCETWPFTPFSLLEKIFRWRIASSKPEDSYSNSHKSASSRGCGRAPPPSR